MVIPIQIKFNFHKLATPKISKKKILKKKSTKIIKKTIPKYDNSVLKNITTFSGNMIDERENEQKTNDSITDSQFINFLNTIPVTKDKIHSSSESESNSDVSFTLAKSI